MTLRSHHRSGVVLVAALVILLVVSSLLILTVQRMLLAQRQLRHNERQMQALYLADAGEELALRRLADSADYQGETWQPRLSGESETGLVVIRIERPAEDSSHWRLIVESTYPEHTEIRGFIRRERRLPAAAPGGSS